MISPYIPEQTETNCVCENMSFFLFGHHRCEPGHCASGEYVDRYLIHYIYSGKGKVVCDGKTYYLERGNAFLITGKGEIYYEADKQSPWYYEWINISGSMAEKFLKCLSLSRKNPIYKTTNPEKIEEQLKLLNAADKSNDFLLSGAVYNLLGQMIAYSAGSTSVTRKTATTYVNLCVNYIQLNYNKRITVDELCRFVGLEHSYLYRLFQKELHTSPCEFIISYKIKKAKYLLETSSPTMDEVAQYVGYDDKSAFSKLFQKKVGITPLKYKKLHEHSSANPVNTDTPL